MTSKPLIVHATVALLPSLGGTPMAVNDFHRAQEAKFVAFSNPAKLAAEGSMVPGAIHVPVRGNPVARWFAWAGAAARREADQLAAAADLLVCHGLYRYQTHWVAQWARRRGIPYWSVLHGALDPYVFTYRAGVKKVWMYCFGRSFLAGAARVIFTTEQERRKAAVRYTGTNTRVVPLPVTPLDMCRAGELRALARARLGLAKEARLLLTLGRLHDMKRILETVAAVGAAGCKHVYLAVVGPEQTITLQQVHAAGRQHGLGQRLYVPGAAYGEAKEAWLHACDGFISLSWRENFGYSAVEALTAGKPVILSPGNDLCGELKPRRSGWFLPDDRLETAVAAIREWAVASEEELRARGERGQCFALHEFSRENFAGRLQGLVEETLTA